MRKIYLLLLVVFIFWGCTTKVVEVPTYVKAPMPILKTYEVNATYSFGKLKNNNGKVCVLKWNACIPKKDFIKLITFIEKYKTNLEKANKEIELYNNMANNYNEKGESFDH